MPLLCIDTRAASELSSRGMIAQELVDQFASAQSQVGLEQPQLEGQRTLMLAHPGQILPDQLARFDTRMKLRRSPVHWFWERNFLKTTGIGAFHRFRPVDRLAPYPSCTSLTTLLPPRKRLPFFLSHREKHTYVVPSTKEAKLLEKTYNVPQEQIAVIHPSVRRYVHYVDKPVTTSEGWILFLTGARGESPRQKRWVKVIAERFPELAIKIIRMKNTDLSPLAWLKLLQHTKVCVYLASKPFDWPTLALESFFWGIPTLFSDEHNALSELLPQSPFSISHFLVDNPDLESLRKQVEGVWEKLSSEGVFKPDALAMQYGQLYRKLGISVQDS